MSQYYEFVSYWQRSVSRIRIDILLPFLLCDIRNNNCQLTQTLWNALSTYGVRIVLDSHFAKLLISQHYVLLHDKLHSTQKRETEYKLYTEYKTFCIKSNLRLIFVTTCMDLNRARWNDDVNFRFIDLVTNEIWSDLICLTKHFFYLTFLGLIAANI